MNAGNFFGELKRRNVYKVAVAYAVVSWLLLQAASILFPAFEAPAWVMKVFIALLVLFFPVALILSWAFEITPEGIKRESEVAPNESITRHTGRRIVGLSIVVATIAAGLLAFQLWGPKRVPTVTTTAPASAPNTVSVAAPVPVTEKSIAVLPFENLSDDKSNAYFAEGIQDEILTRLAKVSDLKVISRTSTQHFKSSPENLPEIAKQLGVRNILEGSVQREPDQVRVNVQLINAMTDAHLWADIYDRKLTDIFSVESDIAKTIADTLQAKLTGSEKVAMAKTPTEDPEAYQLYLQGRFFWNKRTGPDLRRSIDYFDQAIKKDPGYALAYAASAQAWLLLPAYNGGAPNDCAPQAEAAAKKALRLDDTSADAHAAMGDINALYHFDYPGANAELERAVQLNPNNATAHHWLGNAIFGNTGQAARAIAEMKRAQELDPLSLVINTNLGVAWYTFGKLDEGIAQLRKTVEMDDSFYFSHWNLGVALQMKGEIPEALAEYKKASELSDDPAALGYLGQLEGLSGHQDEARKILAQLRQRRGQQYTCAYALAIVCLGLGERKEAVDWLEQGYRERDGFNIGSIRIDPILRPLQGDPRFEALADKVVPAQKFGTAAATAE